MDRIGVHVVPNIWQSDPAVEKVLLKLVPVWERTLFRKPPSNIFHIYKMGQTTSQKLQTRAVELSLLEQTCFLHARVKEEEADELESLAKTKLSEPDRLSEICNRWSLRKREGAEWQRKGDLVHRVVEKLENAIVMHSFGTEISKLNRILSSVKIETPEQLLGLLDKIENQLNLGALPESANFEPGTLLTRLQDEHGLALLEDLPPLVESRAGAVDLEERFKELTGRSV